MIPSIISLWRNREGVVSIMVAVVLIILVAAGGAAVEMSKLLYVRQSLQQNLDGAAMAAAAVALTERLGSTPDTKKMSDTANQYFTANNRLDSSVVTAAISMAYNDDTSAANQDSVVATVTASMPVTFWWLTGQRKIDFTLTATAKRPRPAPVELVLAMDVTASMGDAFGATTKLSALKTTAKSLVSVLLQSSTSKVGLVPFAAYINIGTDQGYTDATLQESRVPWLTFGAKPVIYDCVKYSTDPADCTTTTTTCYKDGKAYSCQVTSCKCTESKLRSVSFTGCVFLRTGTYQNTIASPTLQQYVGFWTTCTGPAITNLVSKDQSFASGGKTLSAEAWLNSKIDSLSVNFNGNIGTYIPAPLIWGWNMLTTETDASGSISSDFPLQSGYTAAEVQKLKAIKGLVLITDGTNSMYASGGGGLALISKSSQPTTNEAAAESDLRAVCSNIKASGVKIYVVALQAEEDLRFRQLMQDCSGALGESWDQGYFFDAQNATQLSEAFAKIGRSFSLITLTN